jgi:hypothetical protein
VRQVPRPHDGGLADRGFGSLTPETRALVHSSTRSVVEGVNHLLVLPYPTFSYLVSTRVARYPTFTYRVSTRVARKKERTRARGSLRGFRKPSLLPCFSPRSVQHWSLLGRKRKRKTMQVELTEREIVDVAQALRLRAQTLYNLADEFPGTGSVYKEKAERLTRLEERLSVLVR